MVPFRDFLSILRKRWLSVVVATVLGLGLVASLSLTATPVYQARASVYFSLPYANTASELSQGSNYTQSQMLSYTSLATTPAVLGPVIEQLQLGVTPSQLADSVLATAQPETVLIEIQASNPSPQLAADIANRVAVELGAVAKQLSPKAADGRPAIDASTVAAAAVPSTPASPSTRRNVAAGGAAGLFLGVLLAVLREMLDTTIRTPELLRRVGQVPVLGVIGWDREAKRKPLIVDSQARSRRAEAFRQLRTNLQFIDVEQPVTVSMVTSAGADEGKSTTAVNLAIAIAESGRRVLLVEADLRRPTVVDYLNVEGSIGLTDVLAGTASLDEALQPWGAGTLTVLASGTLPPNPSELLGSHAMIDLIAILRSRFDMVVLDTPPVLPVTDAAVAAALTDGVVLVVRAGQTSRNRVGSALRALEAVDARILGTVLTMAPLKDAEPYDTVDDRDTETGRKGTRTKVLPSAMSAERGNRPTSHLEDVRSGLNNQPRHASGEAAPNSAVDVLSDGVATPVLRRPAEGSKAVRQVRMRPPNHNIQ